MNIARWRQVIAIAGTLLIFSTLGAESLQAQNRQNRWVADSTYARLYDPATLDTLHGTIARIDRIASPGRRATTGIHIELDTGAETLPVHLGPAFFVEDPEQPLRVGDEIKVTGSRVTFQGEAALIATQMRHGDRFLQLRTADGRPMWRGRRGPR
ncbi:hypothetical protein CRI94_16865 [Longibacter salinarum]|uniref:Magnetosome protein MamS/MamX domain-containing protein n=1 Tax=Longibacter salinarum TaxID=1850348 RepID=A0A2A8CTR6_9BACT|nr:hypothetical protein [Longibacter salinarum]PEN11092.1 hypothetical protein CRI94_16865 [Longibacter salinarum]